MRNYECDETTSVMRNCDDMRNYKLIWYGIILVCALTLKSGNSVLCYGSLQANPEELVNESLDLSAYNSMYLYTQPLSNSSCSQGYLIGFNFCYRTTNKKQNVTEPVFTTVLLQDTGSDYIVRHIYREMEDEIFCLGYSTKDICCRWVTFGSTLSLTVNSSFVLAVVTSTALSAGNRSLYVTPKYSSGVVYSPPPTPLGELGSSIVGLDRAAGQIPELFIRIVLKEKDKPKTNADDSFFDKYLPIVVGGSVFLFALFALCVAGLIFGTLTAKMKYLQKRVQHIHSQSTSLASTSNFKDAQNDSTNITVVQNETYGLSIENPSEADGNMTTNDPYGVAQEPENNSSNITMVQSEIYGLSIENLPEADDNITTNEAYGIVPKPENNRTNITVVQNEAYGLFIEKPPENGNITTNEAYGVVLELENDINITMVQNETYALTTEVNGDITSNEAYGGSQDLEPDYEEIP